MRRAQGRRLDPSLVGLLVLVLAAAATYLAFTKEIPFRGHYEIEAVARTANDLRPGSLVRIAGVNVGEVTKVEGVAPGGDGATAARITMRVAEKGRPIHTDATMKIRPRIFLEGNFFVDLEPGSPSAPELRDGEAIPIQQVSAPVQIDQVLGAFQSDTRADLRTLLDELRAGYANGGAEASNRTQQYLEAAGRDSAIVNDATRGVLEHDLSGYLEGAGRVAAGLDRNGARLQSLITDLRITGRAFAARDGDLSAAIAELPRTLRTGRPALAALNGALPSVRRFTADLRPGVRSTPATLDAQIPFIRQLRAAVARPELRGLARDLRPTVPALARFNRSSIGLLEESRALSSCQNDVVLKTSSDTIEDPQFPSIGPVFQEFPKPFVGLASESRSFDANGQWFRVALNLGQFGTPVGSGRVMLTDEPLLGANPPKPAQRSPLRPDVPCETQEPPDLRTNPAPAPEAFEIAQAPAEVERRAREVAVEWMRDELVATGRDDDVTVTDELLAPSELGKIPAVPGVTP